MLKDCRGNLVMTKPIKIALIVTASILLVTIILLSVFLGLSMNKNNDWLSVAENSFEQSFYELSDSVFEIETALAKFGVVRSVNLQQDLLLKAALESQQASSDLTHMSFKDVNIMPLVKYVNQCGDYCEQLLKKLDRGQTLTQENYDTLSDMSQNFMNLGYGLAQIRQNIQGGNGKFVEQLGKLSESLTTGMSDILSNVEYPSLIYDGAFSDALTDRQPKCLPQGEISSNEGMDIAKQYLSEFELADITFLEENRTNITSYLYEFTTTSGDNGSIQITKNGGLPQMWNLYHEVDNPMFSQEDCLQKALGYCEKNKLQANYPVWQSVVGSVLFVNLCYAKDDLIYYPDMIKLKVSLQTGKVIGFEGLNYIYNHCERQPQTPVVTLQQVQNMDFGNMQIESIRLCVIPIDGGGEALTYEVYGELAQSKYYIYVDAITGYEIKALKVIDSDEGTLTA